MTPLAWIIAGALAILVHEGWERRRAFAMNLLSASTFLVGGLLAWGAARAVDLSFLLPLTAGNFLYIAASDLVPEVREDRSLPKEPCPAHPASAGSAISTRSPPASPSRAVIPPRCRSTMVAATVRPSPGPAVRSRASVPR